MKEKEEENSSIQTVTYPSVIEDFVRSYAPVDLEGIADMVFTRGMLRNALGAYPRKDSENDPLDDYLAMLAGLGFTLHLTSYGEPGLLCIIK